MDNLDKNRQKAVWQRVMDPPRGREDGFDVYANALALQMAYRQLSGSVPGAKGLYEEQMDTTACLRGLMRLAGRTVPTPRGIPPQPQGTEKLLLWCYRQSRQAAAEYLARSTDGETGLVFRVLSDRAGSHCAKIASLLGKL